MSTKLPLTAEFNAANSVLSVQELAQELSWQVLPQSPWPVITWSQELDAWDTDIGDDLAIAPDGAIYSTGYTAGRLARPEPQDNRDVFLTKHGRDGSQAWAVLLGGGGDSFLGAIAAAADALYVVGSTQENLHGQTVAPSDQDAFISKYAPDGNRLWTYLLSTPLSDSARDLTLGLDGSLYTTWQTSMRENNQGIY